MTQDHTDKIEVTQADRDAAQAYIDDRRHFKQTGLPGSGPSARQIMDEHFARHAHDARIEGARATLEAAAKGAKYPVVLPAWAQRSGLSLQDYISAWEDGHLDHNEAIRTLDPEQIVKGMAIV